MSPGVPGCQRARDAAAGAAGGGIAMHVVVVRMGMDPARTGEVDRHVAEDVVPWARAQPGFLTGRWLRSTDGLTGLGIIAFDGSEAAEKAAAGPRGMAYPPDNAWSIADVTVFEQVEEV
jgi:hypothetical protein